MSAFVLVMPDGSDDGFLCEKDGRGIAEAQRLLARPQRWTTLAREGWRVDEVSAEEMRRRCAARLALEADR